MSGPFGNPSFRAETSRIRHLDAAGARAIVDAFRRPVVAAKGLARHAHALHLAGLETLGPGVAETGKAALQRGRHRR